MIFPELCKKTQESSNSGIPVNPRITKMKPTLRYIIMKVQNTKEVKKRLKVVKD